MLIKFLLNNAGFAAWNMKVFLIMGKKISHLKGSLEMALDELS